MENVNSAIRHIELEIIALESKICKLRDVLKILDFNTSLKEPSVHADLESNYSRDADEKGWFYSQREYADYPIDGKIHLKMRYIDEKFPHAFTNKKRAEMLVKIEGKKSESRYTNFTTQLKILINQGHYLAIRFNKKKSHTIYVRPEWLNTENNNTQYTEGHQPVESDIAHIPSWQRDLNCAEIINKM